MATVRQSITALYEEAQRLAVECAPMLAVLQSDAAGPDAPPYWANADSAIPLPVTGIAARFEELRRLAELEAGPAAEPSETPVTDETRFDAPNYPLAGIDLSAGFGAAPEDTGEPVPETPGDATPAAQAVNGIETGPFLPDEPPAPASDNPGDDLDIAYIHTLVREAWENETALGEIVSPEAGEQSADRHAKAADIAATGVAATGNIETAMQEIAAAVVQSADSGQGIYVEAMKREIIAAMRAELQAVVDSGLKSVIKTAVAEAMADMPVMAPPAGQAAKKAPKTAPKVTRNAAPKAPAKKAAKAAAKAALKTAPKKAAAKKKTANGKTVDGNES